MPKLAALSGPKFFSHTLEAPRQPSVIESPRKRTSTPPFLAMATKDWCRLMKPSCGLPSLSTLGEGVAAAVLAAFSADADRADSSQPPRTRPAVRTNPRARGRQFMDAPFAGEGRKTGASIAGAHPAGERCGRSAVGRTGPDNR